MVYKSEDSLNNKSCLTPLRSYMNHDYNKLYIIIKLILKIIYLKIIYNIFIYTWLSIYIWFYNLVLCSSMDSLVIELKGPPFSPMYNSDL